MTRSLTAPSRTCSASTRPPPMAAAADTCTWSSIRRSAPPTGSSTWPDASRGRVCLSTTRCPSTPRPSCEMRLPNPDDREAGVGDERVAAFAPGRVNLIGEHTDYNGGLCLPFARGRGITVSARPIAGTQISVLRRDSGEEDMFESARPGPATGWRAYVRGVCAELAAAGPAAPAARVEIDSDLPAGVGLSSSAALEVALALAL